MTHPTSDDPHPRHTFSLDGVAMSYLDVGPREGLPVVMVHGNPTWSYAFRNVVAALQDRYRCLACDHVGMGQSDKPADYNYTLAQRVADFERWLNHVVPEGPMVLVVHDWGGMIGLSWAVHHVERVAGVVALNTAGFHLPENASIPLSLKLARMPGVGDVLMRGCNAFSRGLVRHGTVTPLPKATRQQYLAPYNSWANRIAVHRFVQDIPLESTHPSYETVTATEAGLPRLHALPFMVGWGMHDFVFTEPFLDAWELAMPEAEVHRYPNAGHLVLEDAAEEIIPRIDQFLTEKVNP